MATWLELLDDQRWQMKKNEILSRDNTTCQNPNCKSKPYTSVQVHHLYYFPGKSPWEYTDDMLLTLCKPCHELELQRNRAEWHMLQTLKSKGFLISNLLAFSMLIETDKEFTETLLKTLIEFENG